MATHRSVRLKPDQALHERLTRAVALRMQTTPYVIKGETAPALLYGLDRRLVGLDFDVRCSLWKYLDTFPPPLSYHLRRPLA